MQTSIQREIVPTIQKLDPQLAEQLDNLEKEAQRLFQSHFGREMPDPPTKPATFGEFCSYVMDLGRSARSE